MNPNEKADFAAKFGAFIREAREKRGIPQKDVADQVDVSRAYYCYIEAGQRHIPLALAIEICKALNADIGKFAAQLK